MKKYRFLSVFLLLLTSCNSSSVLSIVDVVWKESCFDIVCTSTQLNNQYENFGYGHIPNDEYFSSISFLNKVYSCSLYFANNDFTLTLENPDTNTPIYLYENQKPFLLGFYRRPVKVNNEAYDYHLIVYLYSECEYYRYCELNNLEFPEEICFYGYKI